MLRHELPLYPRTGILSRWITLLLLAATLPVDASQLSIVDPINVWIDAFTGPIAFGLGILVLVGMGIAFAAGKVDFQQVGITSAVTVILLGIVFFARPLIRELFGVSATPAAALLGF